MIKKNTYKNIRRWKIENVCHGIKAHVRPSDVTATPKRNPRVLKIFRVFTGFSDPTHG
jgi:hypothetical protein